MVKYDICVSETLAIGEDLFEARVLDSRMYESWGLTFRFVRRECR